MSLHRWKECVGIYFSWSISVRYISRRKNKNEERNLFTYSFFFFLLLTRRKRERETGKKANVNLNYWCIFFFLSSLKLDTSKSASVSDISKGLSEKKIFAEQKQYRSIGNDPLKRKKKNNFFAFLTLDSGHIQSESPSPTDLSPPSTSPQILTSIMKSESTTYVSWSSQKKKKMSSCFW